MSNDTTTVTLATKKLSYDPNDSESEADFWEGANIEHNGKVIGTARRRGVDQKIACYYPLTNNPS